MFCDGIKQPVGRLHLRQSLLAFSFQKPAKVNALAGFSFGTLDPQTFKKVVA